MVKKKDLDVGIVSRISVIAALITILFIIYQTVPEATPPSRIENLSKIVGFLIFLAVRLFFALPVLYFALFLFAAAFELSYMDYWTKVKGFNIKKNKEYAYDAGICLTFFILFLLLVFYLFIIVGLMVNSLISFLPDPILEIIGYIGVIILIVVIGFSFYKFVHIPMKYHEKTLRRKKK